MPTKKQSIPKCPPPLRTQKDHISSLANESKGKGPALSNLLGELDGQLSRFYNGMNTLDRLADLLKVTSATGATDLSKNEVLPVDRMGKLDDLLETFNHLNNRLEATTSYLEEII